MAGPTFSVACDTVYATRVEWRTHDGAHIVPRQTEPEATAIMMQCTPSHTFMHVPISLIKRVVPASDELIMACYLPEGVSDDDLLGLPEDGAHHFYQYACFKQLRGEAPLLAFYYARP